MFGSSANWKMTPGQDSWFLVELKCVGLTPTTVVVVYVQLIMARVSMMSTTSMKLLIYGGITQRRHFLIYGQPTYGYTSQMK